MTVVFSILVIQFDVFGFVSSSRDLSNNKIVLEVPKGMVASKFLRTMYACATHE